MENRVKRVVLTGGSGFVGANLARRCLAEGHDVHLILRPGYAAWRLEDILPRITLHLADVAERAPIEGLLRELRPQWVFHLAASGAYSWQTDVDEMVRTNVSGTINLVRASLEAGVEAFVHTGSSSEYGAQDHAPGEDEALVPNSDYAVTKAAATLYCSSAARRLAAPLVTLRLYSAYGPYEDPRRLLPRLIEAGLAGKLPPLAHPATARDFVYVDDVCEAYLLAADAASRVPPGSIYNVGSGQQLSLAEVVKLVRQVLEIKEEPQWGSLPPRSWDTSIWVAKNDKIRRDLGWQPRDSFAEGLKKMIEWTRLRLPGSLK